MIVQDAPAAAPHFVITMDDHTALAADFARAFGNHRFAPVEPRDIVIEMVANHDRGWRQWDADPDIDPLSGLPHGLTNTPLEIVLATNTASPDFNQSRHPYAGLLSSMHSEGLYCGRFGLSDHLSARAGAPGERPALDAMLAGERDRQARLKAQLAADPETASWIESDRLFQNYKQLQFFDTLALYFNMRPPEARKVAAFQHVPEGPGRDVTVEIRPRGDEVYGLAPFPFAGGELTISFRGRYLTPRPPGDKRSAADLLAALPWAQQSVTLIPT